MKTIRAYAPHIHEVSSAELAGLDTVCIDERIWRNGLRVPSGDAGVIDAIHKVLLAHKARASRHEVAKVVLQATGQSLEHDGGCGGDKARPRLPRLYAAADPAALFAGVESMSLNLHEDDVAHVMSASIRRGKARSRQTGSDIRDDIRTAADTVTSEGGVATLGQVSVAGRKHAGNHIISLPGRHLFDAEAAWQAGNPAYAITFGAVAEKYGPTAGLVGVPMSEVLAQIAMDAVLIAGDQLTAPATGRTPEVVAYNP